MTPSSPKSLLRRAYSEKRLSIAPELAAAHAQSLMHHFLEHPEFSHATSVSGYMPIRGEMDVMPLLTSLQSQGISCALPVPDPSMRMVQFHLWQPGDAMIPDAYGTPAPLSDTEILSPQLVIVPLLAFDDTGHRLGYGGGYYDRTLEFLRAHTLGLIAVGAAFEAQKSDALPAGDHDQKLDYVITEAGIYSF